MNRTANDGVKGAGPQILIFFFLCFMFVPTPAFAMHIMEGFLPFWWCVFWYGVSVPFFVLGLRSIKKTIADKANLKMLLGLCGAFMFVLSALKLPSVTGSCSHPTGVGLGAMLFGPTAMTVMGSIVLVFQALLLAHGGISTLGANVLSMAIVGPMVAWLTYRASNRLRLPQWTGVFLAATLGDLCTYVVTAMEMALAFPAKDGGFMASAVKFLAIFAVTQIPLAVCEGLLTLIVFNALSTYSTDDLRALPFFSNKEA
ncbi:MAG: energy-coupling factor ABC transporter permease [Nitrospirae bacterium]|uniref:energy-coupling factor ABC transporter permease n=1 Tax=Candidatus Magnetobacterium casense TaxID=1455061 RepID=UPI00058B456C|nr:energy-coupling factor ABC transporter permease [Candidatus Magnetobacterium casensis]MBF0336544.1 energy-coupling factor ABC transporter permease [Nitrospirota bacterium]